MPILNFFKKRKKVLILIIAIFFATIFMVAKITTLTAFAQSCAEIKDVTVGSTCTDASGTKGTCGNDGLGSYQCEVKGGPTAGQQTIAAVSQKGGGGFWDWIGNIAFSVVFKILYAITYCILYIFGLFLEFAGKLLDFVLTKPELNQFAKSPIVVAGWNITKNLANMFFALILLIISFATILRIESYGVKQVLPRLIIAALLINFSLVIGGVFIDFSQVMTKYFVDKALEGTSGGLSATIAQKLQVSKGILSTYNQEAKTPPISESLDGLGAAIIGLFAGIIVVLIAAFVFFAAALLFVVRYIALLFLLILAPLAWFFYIVPMTKKYWDMWWSTFFKWVFFAPAYAFFLYLSMMVIKSDVLNEVGIKSVPPGGGGLGRYTIPMLIDYTIIIGFLLGSLIVAQKMGVWGGGAMLGWVKSAGRGFGRMTGRWAARGAPMPVVAPVLKGLDRVTFRKLGLGKAAAAYEARKAAVAEKIKKVPYVGAAVGAAAAIRETLPTLFVPAVWKRAMAQSRATAEASSFPKAAGTLQGLLNLSVKEANIRRQQAHDGEVQRKKEEFTKSYQHDDTRMAADLKSKVTNPVEREALVQAIAAENGMNEIMKSERRPDNPIEYREYIREKFGEEEGARIAASVGGIGKSIKNYGYCGMTEFDDKKQRPVFVSNDEKGNKKQAELAQKAREKEEPQDLARGTRAGTFVGTDKDGNEYLHETGQQILRNITPSETAQVNRMKPETLKALYAIRKSINELANTVEKEARNKGETTQQGNIIRKFVVEVENKYAGEGVAPKQQSSPLAGGTTQEELNKARSQHPPGAFG